MQSVSHLSSLVFSLSLDETISAQVWPSFVISLCPVPVVWYVWLMHMLIFVLMKLDRQVREIKTD
jgi:hypothetical protein